MKPLQKSIRIHVLNLCLLLTMLLSSSLALAQDCDDCVYYETKHFSRVEDHPDLGDWDLLRPLCLPLDGEVNVMVTAEGMTASKFEVTLKVVDDCMYDNTDPIVEFVDEDNIPIDDPTEEEYGMIEVIDMTSTSVTFEYTHPTDQPENGEKFRTIYLAVKDSSASEEMYFQVGRIIINVYRPPVVLVHGLWSHSGSFTNMMEALTESEYEEEMVLAVDYSATHGSSFSVNSDVVPAGINALVYLCRGRFVSAGKVNLVGHSMGGILSRLYLQGAYRSDVYRLITCNTPHSGAQTANFLLDPYWNPGNWEVQDILDAIKMPWENGAVDDLHVTSPAITDLNNGTHPADVGVHALVTTKDAPTLWDIIPEEELSKSVVLPLLASLVTICEGIFINNLFESDEHDCVVAKESQTGGLSVAYTSQVIDQAHVGSTANPEVIFSIKDLLNEPYNSTSFTFAGYSPPVLTYTNDLGCLPHLDGSEVVINRSSSVLTFGAPAPGDVAWTGGDTASIAVTGTGVDTIVLIFEISPDHVYMDKQPGPEATFNFVIPDEQEGNAGIVAFGYSADNEFIEFTSDTMDVEAAYHLTGISVFPLKIFSGVGDTNDLQITGHYDDGIDRSLNGHPDLQFQFTTWSASSTGSDDIVLYYPMDDTLVVQIDSFSSPMVKINFSPNPAGPVFWLGGNGEWTEDSKWDIGCAPGPGNTVYINSGQCTIPEFIPGFAKAVLLTNASMVVNGSLTLSGAIGTALNINKSSVENNGEINIMDSADSGIALIGTASDSAFYSNNGDVTISICAGTYGVYIGPNTFFLNDTSGMIAIDSCGNSRSIEIQSQGEISLENRGILSVDGGPVAGVGRLLNSGEFTLHHSTPNMYTGFSAVYLRNTSAGSMHFENISGSAIRMIYSGDSLINEGIMTIATATDQGVNAKYCRNSGTMQFNNINNEAVFIEGNDYFFNNTNSGLLQISNADIGIYVRNSNAHFENHGIIEIDTTGAQGILVKFHGRFTNAIDGIVYLRQCGTKGINVLDNTNTIFDNFGNIEITQTGESGVHVSGNGAFHNDSTGRILLYDLGESGLRTSGNSLQGNTIITNAGNIDIEQPIAAYGIDHKKRFTNEACGIIRTEKQVQCIGANFNNNGYIHLRNTAAHSITQKIVNNGWIEDMAGLLDPSTHVTNNAVIAAPVEYGGCSGVDIMDVFTLGSLAGYTVSDGFSEATLTSPAGTFDSLTNSFTPNSIGILSPAWFFSVTNNSENCSDTIEVNARVICPVNCTGDPYFWTGCTDVEWNNTANWNLGVLPTGTDSVTITSSPAGALFPEIIDSVFLAHLNLQPGSELKVKTGATLKVNE